MFHLSHSVALLRAFSAEPWLWGAEEAESLPTAAGCQIEQGL